MAGATNEARIEVIKAGRLLLPAGLNKYEPGTLDHAEWELGRLQAIAEQLQRLAGLAGMVA